MTAKPANKWPDSCSLRAGGNLSNVALPELEAKATIQKYIKARSAVYAK
jgi:hypothetical protein